LVFRGRGKKSRWCDKSQCHLKTKKKRKEKNKRGIVILIGRNAYHTDIVNVLILNDYCHDMLAKERKRKRKKERKDKRDKTMKKRNTFEAGKK
jgi:predicted nucleic acid-binding protein